MTHCLWPTLKGEELWLKSGIIRIGIIQFNLTLFIPKGALAHQYIKGVVHQMYKLVKTYKLKAMLW